jgi:hypothetical protein
MRTIIVSISVFLLTIPFSIASAQSIYEFTSAGATGLAGPTQAQLNTAYSGTSLNGTVTSQSGIQRWVVPSTGSYTILADGAQGGGSSGGQGASIQGEFNLLAGDTLYIIVGQEGESTGANHLAGGGASYVVQGAANNILVIAGGGGGAASSGSLTGGTTALNGQDGAGGSQGLGGTSGQGGAGASCRGGGGAGWLSAGTVGGCGGSAGQGGLPFSQGGEGGGLAGAGAEGGFGGGGSSEGANTAWSYCGGGGGYSGGGGGSGNGTAYRGGGGGSINNGINQVNASSAQSGDGSVIITSLSPPAPNNAGLNFFVNPQTVNGAVCVGSASVDVVIQNYGANQISSLTIGWTINGTAQTSVSYTSLLDTFGGIGNVFDTVNLGTINIANATNLVAWTSMPNGSVDTLNSNDTASLIIDSVVVVELDLGPDLTTCSGNSIFVENIGSSQIFSTYNWSTGSSFSNILVSTPGIYSVTVTYGPPQCQAVDSIEVFAAANPVVVLGESFETCGDTLLDAQNQGMSFVWSNGDTVQSIILVTTSYYSVTVTSAEGCVGTDEVYATINPLPEVDLGEDFEICVDKNEATFIGVSNSATNTYAWNNGATNNLIIVGVIGSSPGNNTFSLTVTNENGCSASDTINVLYKNCLVGVESVDRNQNWKVYPVPADDIVFIDIEELSSDISLDVYDIDGRYLRNLYSGASNGAEQISSDVSDLSSGVYLIRLSSDENTSVKQIVIH